MSNSIQSLPKALETSRDLQRAACLLLVLMKRKRSYMLWEATLVAMLRIKSSLKKSILIYKKRRRRDFVVFSGKGLRKSEKDR